MARNPSDVTEFPPLPGIPTEPFSDGVRPAVESFNRVAQEWYQKLNGGIGLGGPDGVSVGNGRAWSGHFDGEILTVVVPEADADFPVTHQLNRIPLGFIEIDQTAEERLHRLETTPGHTTTQLWLRSAAAAGTRYRIWTF